MRYTVKRKAFSMLTAIFVIIIMATVGSMVLNLSGKMAKETTFTFQREQAVLLAKSYTEYAIMAVMSNANYDTNCLNTIQGNNVIRTVANGGFNVTVNIAYIGNRNGRVSSTCSNTISNRSITNRYPLHIIVDVYVKYKKLDNAPGHFFTYHKRTLQKI